MYCGLKKLPIAIASFLFVILFSIPAKAQTASGLSCKTRLYKVSDSYQLPYNNDGTELANGTNLDRTGRYVYTFDIVSSKPATLTKVTVQHVHQGKEPLTIRDLTPHQYQCAQGPEKTITCTLNYSFQDSAHSPLHVLIDMDASSFTDVNTSTMFALETTAGSVSCASYYRFKGEPQTSPSTPSPSSAPVATPSLQPTAIPSMTPRPRTPSTPAPTPNQEIESLKQDVTKLQAELNETRNQQSYLWGVVNSIQSFLSRIFGGLFSR